MKINRRKFIKSALIGTPILAAADAFAVEPKGLRIRRIKIAGGEKSQVRFAHLTDIHFKGDTKYLQRVVEETNRLAPDFVCFTGDLVEEADHLNGALEILNGIKAPIFGVPGNHDYWSHADFGQIAAALRKNGGAWLLDRSIETGDGKARIYGSACQESAPPRPVSVDDRKRNLLLIHYPMWADRFGETKFDLTLAGHSHGGQVRLPFFGPLMVPTGVGRYDRGMFETKAGPLYVSSGIGWFMLPVRFLCRPEITLFEI